MAKSNTEELEDRIKSALDQDDHKAMAREASMILSDLASIGVQVVTESADPGFSTGTYFGGFTTIAMMLQVSKDYPIEKRMAFVGTICNMCISAIMKKEREAKEDE